MKQPSLLLLGFSLLFTACNTSSIVRSAQNKTNREISKKTNKKIEDVFNKKDKDKQQEQEPKVASQPGEKQNTPNETTQTSEDPPVYTSRKEDFLPGDKIIFVDSLKRELMGEFPSKWDLYRGSVENARLGSKNVISFLTNQATIMPLMKTKNYLPDQFTVEFDAYFHNKGNEGYYLSSTTGLSIRLNIAGGSYGGTNYKATKTQHEAGWRRFAIAINKRAMKIYINGERLVSIPNLRKKPTDMQFGALANATRPAMITNIRIAEGGVPLYHRLITDGRIVTQDIHFDYNKASIKTSSMTIIRDIAAMMKEHNDIRLSVEGHTDSDGTDSFNQGLSEQRAHSRQAGTSGFRGS